MLSFFEQLVIFFIIGYDSGNGFERGDDAWEMERSSRQGD
jgi:hypothetical protein